MPSPFAHWDSRSFWHQFFAILDKRTNQIVIHRGNSGSSGAREYNGRWAHTFCHLAVHHKVETPTYHLIYDEHNKLKLHAKYEDFRSLHYDLTGNYHVESYKETDKLFEGRKVDSAALPKLNRWWSEEEEK